MLGLKSKEDMYDLEFFTVYDSKSQSYREPFPAPNKDVLIRDFVNSFRKPDAQDKNVYFQNAEDYSVFRIGRFRFREGLMKAGNAEHVFNMHDIKAMVMADRPGIVPT